MASTGYVNIIGSMFSLYFYTWLHPDLNRCVRIGFNQYKVDQAVYFGTVVWLILSTSCIAPRMTHRTNALVGNIGMAVCSILVIVNHWLLENKWVWAGILYVVNILFYVCCMGLVLMGQNSKYHYDRSRFYKLCVPIASTVFMTLLCYQFIANTDYADEMPWISFNFHTIMAILAQVAAPRTETFDFFDFLNTRKRQQVPLPRKSARGQ
ncbi:unnamed protein product [Caenorhabditis sp. 36 PRJEB53466]|nr:unnamed protein product [Caenorhabditis sp. 36 PRJEB53466]